MEKTTEEGDFLAGLIELQYGQPVVDTLKQISQHVDWAHGWPEDKVAFWNAEAFMWRHKIDKEKRALIQQELAFLQGGRNLDLGCGAYSYIPSVGLDISPTMLLLNDLCTEKIIGDVEKKLPFTSGNFDSVTALFLCNYVVNYHSLLQEIKRVLKHKGYFLMVLSAKKINDWQRQKEVHRFSVDEWTRIILTMGFEVKAYSKEELHFWVGRKSKSY